jgi:hypothetical protein
MKPHPPLPAFLAPSGDYLARLLSREEISCALI